MVQVVANEILTKKWIPYVGRVAGASKKQLRTAGRSNRIMQSSQDGPCFLPPHHFSTQLKHLAHSEEGSSTSLRNVETVSHYKESVTWPTSALNTRTPVTFYSPAARPISSCVFNR
jgi:hypothetical protein